MQVLNPSMTDESNSPLNKTERTKKSRKFQAYSSITSRLHSKQKSWMKRTFKSFLFKGEEENEVYKKELPFLQSYLVNWILQCFQTTKESVNNIGIDRLNVLCIQCLECIEAFENNFKGLERQARRQNMMKSWESRDLLFRSNQPFHRLVVIQCLQRCCQETHFQDLTFIEVSHTHHVDLGNGAHTSHLHIDFYHQRRTCKANISISGPTPKSFPFNIYVIPTTNIRP